MRSTISLHTHTNANYTKTIWASSTEVQCDRSKVPPLRKHKGVYLIQGMIDDRQGLLRSISYMYNTTTIVGGDNNGKLTIAYHNENASHIKQILQNLMHNQWLVGMVNQHAYTLEATLGDGAKLLTKEATTTRPQ